MQIDIRQEVLAKIGTGFLIGIGGIGVAFIISVLMAFPLKWLWNWIMPYLFGLPIIGFWKAWGINFLCAFLFKGHTTSK